MRSPSGQTHPIDPRLVALLGIVSNHFGSRKIEVVSGFRPYSPTQYTPHSNHNIGKAIDFRVDGVPNEVVRDFCRTLRQRGLRLLPEQHVFVHMDVRDELGLLDRLLEARRAAALQRAERRRRRRHERRRGRDAHGGAFGAERQTPDDDDGNAAESAARLVIVRNSACSADLGVRNDPGESAELVTMGSQATPIAWVAADTMSM